LKRALCISLVLVAAGLLSAVAVVHAKVSPQAIASSVTHTPELLERAWQLPVALIGTSAMNEMIYDQNKEETPPA
jgi:hypothetical protein